MLVPCTPSSPTAPYPALPPSGTQRSNNNMEALQNTPLFSVPLHSLTLASLGCSHARTSLIFTRGSIFNWKTNEIPYQLSASRIRAKMHISYEFISVMKYICSYVQIKHVLVPCVVGCWRLLLLLFLRLLLPLLMPLPLLFFFSHTLMLVWKTAVCFLHICINSYYCMYPNIIQIHIQ